MHEFWKCITALLEIPYTIYVQSGSPEILKMVSHCRKAEETFLKESGEKQRFKAPMIKKYVTEVH